ncbi:MAG: DUF3892 domain-containing protein [Mucilaginibacter sp.]|uniref:DUF3892 domain-containing protein n=1 Tax=Mucilaginibacter sp. L3T2-6 TaxID=3062491 RepID=UPI0026745AED|nr:DUF3892 domain-containing protein [Mucilaginibacter sp. L3T2-6]MDO3642461.1 DUF3892 domain-containing protein [Mucilaginibacter sp. L3T2-6]MDV6215143.1 DUF3892 domain-containing protein [Mucilaginibacter sp. L3T2-6]
MAVRIICIKKDEGITGNPYLAIDYFEWVNERINVNGITDRTQIYDWIKEGNGEAYITDEKGNKVYLIPAICPQGNKYVKTVEDESLDDSLLLLPQCDD